MRPILSKVCLSTSRLKSNYTVVFFDSLRDPSGHLFFYFLSVEQLEIRDSDTSFIVLYCSSYAKLFVFPCEHEKLLFQGL